MLALVGCFLATVNKFNCISFLFVSILVGKANNNKYRHNLTLCYVTAGIRFGLMLPFHLLFYAHMGFTKFKLSRTGYLTIILLDIVEYRLILSKRNKYYG